MCTKLFATLEQIMAEYGHNYQLAAMRLTSPPIREMFTSLGHNPTGVAYEVNPGVLKLLHGKQFKGEEGEDPYQHFFQRCMWDI